jgi:hypothetical protein
VGIEDLELPGGIRVAKPDPLAEHIVNGLAQFLIPLLAAPNGQPLLVSISNQLDLLIRLEVGQKSKSEIKTMLNIYDTKVREAAAAAAEQNGDGTVRTDNADPSTTAVEGNHDD